MTDLRDKIMGCLLGGLLGDAMGGPVEGLHYEFIAQRFGEVTTLKEPRGLQPGAGTDDSALKHMLCEAIRRTNGNVTAAAWAQVWRERMNPFKFYPPVASSFYKISIGGVRAREAGIGNMISNSTAMCISPIGIINAGDPRRAMLEAYEVTSLIHRGSPQDGALAMAAATAAAFDPNADAESVVEAAVSNLDVESDMPAAIDTAVSLARKTRDFASFRAAYYADHLWEWPQQPEEGHSNAVDPRESASVALALLLLADGDPNQVALMSANFGRDADSIGAMGGPVAGAMAGATGIRPQWAAQVQAATPVNQDELADSLHEVLTARLKADRARSEMLLV